MSKAKLKSISKNLKKSSRVHAKQAKQLESIMKKSPTRKNGKVTGKLKRKPIGNKLLEIKDRMPLPKNNIPNSLFKGFDGVENTPFRPGRESEQIKKLKKLLGKKGVPMAKNSALKKISSACKAAAKRKFKVWPSAYASGWGVRCTRNPSKYLKR